MDTTIEEQLIARVRTLSPAEQQQILNQLQTVPHAPTPPGTPGREAARFAGLFPPEDADEITAAINQSATPPGVPGTVWQQFDGIWTPEEAEAMLQASEECRQVDLNEW